MSETLRQEDSPDLSVLQARIRKLERQAVALWVALGSGVALAFLCLRPPPPAAISPPTPAPRSATAAVAPPWHVKANGDIVFDHSVLVGESVLLQNGGVSLTSFGLMIGSSGQPSAWLSGETLAFTAARPHLRKVGEYELPDVSTELSTDGLSVYDEEGALRAALGVVTLTNTKLGGQERTPPSLVLFRKDGRVVSRLPGL